MKILWFSPTSALYSNKNVSSSSTSISPNGGGWISSLANFLKENTNIELAIAFESNIIKSKAINNNITYYPINAFRNIRDKILLKFSLEIEEKKIIPICQNIIEDFKPDIIQVFGSEWCYGLIASKTKVPVIIHIQGSMPPYYYATYPYGFNILNKINYNLFNPIKLFQLYRGNRKLKERVRREEKILKQTAYFFGRTQWDYKLSQLYAPNSKYYHSDEILRPEFYKAYHRKEFNTQKIILVSNIGSGSLMKGYDLILKTSNILKNHTNIQYTWKVIGGTNEIPFIEKHLKMQSKNLNIELLGVLSEKEVVKTLLDSDVYIHPSYIDNSPNSLCEAQILGLPIIATNVGGVNSLINHNYTGLLIPAGEPHMLASNIIELVNNINIRETIAKQGQIEAINRHNPETIVKTLIGNYNKIIEHVHLSIL